MVDTKTEHGQGLGAATCYAFPAGKLGILMCPKEVQIPLPQQEIQCVFL